MKTKLTQKQIRFQALLLFFITFFLVELCAVFLYQNQLKEAKLKADYTAQTTIGRVKSQLNHYLAESNLMKHMIEAGYTVNDEEFSVLSSLMQDDQNVIKAHELAKDGIVTLIYPMSGNEAALGLNMLEHPARKQEARLAKESGEYTIAGPFELQQGDIGALLFDPIYTTDANGDQTFWGFSILVLDWESFLNEIELDTLEEAGYTYELWKISPATGEHVSIAHSGNSRRSMPSKFSAPCRTTPGILKLYRKTAGSVRCRFLFPLHSDSSFPCLPLLVFCSSRCAAIKTRFTQQNWKKPYRKRSLPTKQKHVFCST